MAGKVNKAVAQQRKQKVQKKRLQKSTTRTSTQTTQSRSLFQTTKKLQSPRLGQVRQFDLTRPEGYGEGISENMIANENIYGGSTQFPDQTNDMSHAVSLGDRCTSVTIYKPCKNSMQNQKNDNFSWKLREDRGHAELVNQFSLGDDYFTDDSFYPRFSTVDEAVRFCEKEGISYTVEEEPLRKYDLRSYSDNFKWKGPAAV
jgi:hypothetical protein